MFLSRNKKKNVYPCKPLFYCIKVGLKGVKFLWSYAYFSSSNAYPQHMSLWWNNKSIMWIPTFVWSDGYLQSIFGMALTAAIASAPGSSWDSWFSAVLSRPSSWSCGWDVVHPRLCVTNASMSLNVSKHDPQINVSSGILKRLVHQKYLKKQKSYIGPNTKICMFRVTLPYLIFLVKPSNFFQVFSK